MMTINDLDDLSSGELNFDSAQLDWDSDLYDCRICNAYLVSAVARYKYQKPCHLKSNTHSSETLLNITIIALSWLML